MAEEDADSKGGVTVICSAGHGNTVAGMEKVEYNTDRLAS